MTKLLIQWGIWKQCTCEGGGRDIRLWGHLEACPHIQKVWRR